MRFRFRSLREQHTNYDYIHTSRPRALSDMLLSGLVSILNKIEIIKNTGFPRYFLDRVIFINFPSQGLLVVYSRFCRRVYVYTVLVPAANHLIYNFVWTIMLNKKHDVPSTPKMSIMYYFT